MPTYNIGRIAYVDQGEYNPATSYVKYDVVSYQNGSYSYIYPTTASGNLPTNTTYWRPMLDPTAMNAATLSANEAAQAASDIYNVGDDEPTSPNAKVWLDTNEPDLLVTLEQRIAALEALHP